MAGYVKTMDGKAARFDAEPSPMPVPKTELVIYSVIDVVLWAMHPLAGLIGLLFMGSLYTLFLYWTPKARKYRRATSFKASPDGVEFEGRTFHVADIHRLIIRNHVSGIEGTSVAVGALGVAAANLQNKRLRALAPVSWRLDLEAGGKAATLAGGLDEAAAYGLMREASAVLNMG